MKINYYPYYIPHMRPTYKYVPVRMVKVGDSIDGKEITRIDRRLTHHIFSLSDGSNHKFPLHSKVQLTK